jgi:hypothetical protein
VIGVKTPNCSIDRQSSRWPSRSRLRPSPSSGRIRETGTYSSLSRGTVADRRPALLLRLTSPDLHHPATARGPGDSSNRPMPPAGASPIPVRSADVAAGGHHLEWGGGILAATPPRRIQSLAIHGRPPTRAPRRPRTVRGRHLLWRRALGIGPWRFAGSRLDGPPSWLSAGPNGRPDDAVRMFPCLADHTSPPGPIGWPGLTSASAPRRPERIA